MCEHCGARKVWGNPLDPDDQEGIGCECGKPAVYLVYERCVEDHLCAEHMEEESAELHNGLGDFMRSFRLQQSCKMLPIRQEATCSHLGASLDRCGKRATYAKVVVEEWVLCADCAHELGHSHS